jgi:hypothetical protein
MILSAILNSALPWASALTLPRSPTWRHSEPSTGLPCLKTIYSWSFNGHHNWSKTSKNVYRKMRSKFLRKYSFASVPLHRVFFALAWQQSCRRRPRKTYLTPLPSTLLNFWKSPVTNDMNGMNWHKLTCINMNWHKWQEISRNYMNNLHEFQTGQVLIRCI